MRRSRREFLRDGCYAAGAAALASSVERFGLVNALAQGAPDYKALVCIFLFGGNDGNNTVIPRETGEYNAYATVRGAGAGGLAIPRDSLLPLAPPSHAREFGLHPNLPKLHELWGQQKLAVLCNTGPLIEPLTKAEYQAGGPRPESLFSHSDQQTQWQSAISDRLSRTGWGGRLADAAAALNGGETFPMITSVSGINLFVTGAQARPLAIPSSGGFGLSGFSGSAASQARRNAMDQIRSLDQDEVLVRSTSETTSQAVNLSATLNPILTSTTSAILPLFAGLNTGIARQLQQVVRLIEARATLRLKRQIFFCSLGGFDTHNNQLTTQAGLFAQLDAAMRAFYDATAQLGVAPQVTTFTLSDFGRTLKVASGGGTDHAWGSHHLIMGGAVRGGNFYGTFPTLALQGPDDISREGRWLPSTSVDQYGATLAAWFGVDPGTMTAVYPNLGQFAAPDLGFMS